MLFSSLAASGSVSNDLNESLTRSLFTGKSQSDRLYTHTVFKAGQGVLICLEIIALLVSGRIPVKHHITLAHTPGHVPPAHPTRGGGLGGVGGVLPSRQAPVCSHTVRETQPGNLKPVP